LLFLFIPIPAGDFDQARLSVERETQAANGIEEEIEGLISRRRC
jgi:hypothetical protein